MTDFENSSLPNPHDDRTETLARAARGLFVEAPERNLVSELLNERRFEDALADCERRTDAAFKEAERYRELSLLEAARADRAEAKLAAFIGADGSSSGAMESQHDSATRAAGANLRASELRLQVGWDNIPGRPVLHETIGFDGTPEGFDAAVESIRVAMHEKARAPMRPCGHPGPWHAATVPPPEGDETEDGADG